MDCYILSEMVIYGCKLQHMFITLGHQMRFDDLNFSEKNVSFDTFKFLIALLNMITIMFSGHVVISSGSVGWLIKHKFDLSFGILV